MSLVAWLEKSGETLRFVEWEEVSVHQSVSVMFRPNNHHRPSDAYMMAPEVLNTRADPLTALHEYTPRRSKRRSWRSSASTPTNADSRRSSSSFSSARWNTLSLEDTTATTASAEQQSGKNFTYSKVSTCIVVSYSSPCVCLSLSIASHTLTQTTAAAQGREHGVKIPLAGG